MTKCKDLFKRLRQQQARWQNAGILLLGATVLVVTMVQVAIPGYEEMHSLWRQRRQQRLQLERLQQFAITHADYKAYEEAKYKELVRLKEHVQQALDSNQLPSQLQLWAAKQGLVLKNMQILDEDKGKQPKGQQKGGGWQIKNVQLKLELMGDYFALLRWLRQVEKQRVALSNVEIKGQGQGLVQAKLTLSCSVLSQKKNATRSGGVE